MKRNLCYLWLLLAAIFMQTTTAWAITASPDGVHYTQPDGTVLTMTLQGDEVIHWAITDDGYTLLANSKGAYEYALTDASGAMVTSGMLAHNAAERSSEELLMLEKIGQGVFYNATQVEELRAQSVIQPAYGTKMGGFPTTGTRKMLMILANFSNTTTTYPQSSFDNYMNQVNYNNTGSFRDYYLEASYGQLTVNSTVTVWVTVPNTHDYYGPDSRWAEFVRDAVNAADAAGIDFSQFDNDGDGKVDGIAVIHQGDGQEESGDVNDIWSHSWNLSSGGYYVTKDGVQVDAYTCQPETSAAGMAQIGVMCHEFGHNLGAPDFYDTNYSTGGYYAGTGYWDLMASGSWNGSPSGSKPAHHNMWTKIFYDWVTPVEISAGADLTLANAENSGACYKITTTTSNEYFLLANRQQQGFDVAIPGHGLMIWHVDGNWIASHMNYNDINASSHQGMYPKAAGGTINSASCPFPGTSNNTTFTDTSTPDALSWAGDDTQKPVTGIAESNGVISFVFMGGGSGGNTPVATTQSATDVQYTTATLHGSVNANDETTTVTFEYGTSTAYGTTVNATPSSVSGTTTTAVSAAITGLQEGVTYHFRVKAVNVNGTTTGSDMTFTTASSSVDYCTASGSSTRFEWIDYVALGTISNTTGADGGYGDYTAHSTALRPGNSYTIYFSTGYKRKVYTEYWRIWIDYNGNGLFTDAGELVVSGSSATTGTVSADFTVPSTATMGTTRMRVLMSDNSGTTSSCGTFSYGEVEDYTIVLDPNAAAPALSHHGQPLGHAVTPSVAVYPNPVAQQLFIENLPADMPHTVTLYNEQGRVVHTQHTTGSGIIIAMARYAPGIYLLRLTDGQKVITQRIIHQ